MTLDELHGLIIPPMWSPSKIIMLKPSTAKVPNQSIAYTPRNRLTRGLCTCRQKQSTTKENPKHGRLIHQFLILRQRSAEKGSNAARNAPYYAPLGQNRSLKPYS